MTSTDKMNITARRRTVLAGAVAVIGLAAAATALASPDLVDLKIVDRDTGQVLRTWRHDGRLFVAGEPGTRYGLRVINRTAGRMMVVMSVDGINIVTGETANYNQDGYVLDPWRSYDLNGWRKSRSEIAAFQFAPLPQSYAARTGRPDDVGVIGMAVFKERVVMRPPPVTRPQVWREGPGGPEYGRRGGADAAAAPITPAPAPPAAFGSIARAAPSAGLTAGMAENRAYAGGYDAAPRGEKLGTAHGAREWSVSDTTAFERATAYPQSTRLIEYDTYDNLVACGAIPSSPYPPHRPRPFPANPDQPGFVPDPPAER